MPSGPDIIQAQSIPLSATSDQPVDDVPRPPINASNDTGDQATGSAREITAEELAIAAAARKGDPKTAEMKDEPAKADAKAAEDGEEAQTDVEEVKLPGDPEIDSDAVPDTLRNAARMEVIKERRKAREYRAALEAAVKTRIGDEAWDKAVAQSRDKLVQAEREKAEKAVSDARKAVEDAEKYRKELDDYRATAAQPKEEPDLRPTRDAFDDPDAYDEAMLAWGRRDALREVARVDAEKQAEAKRLADEKANADREAFAIQAHKEWVAKTDEAKQKYEDYDDIVMKDPAEGGPSITPAMAMAIQKRANGTDVAYYLGTDTDESKRIAALSDPMEQIMEIGALSQRLANPPQRAARAPRPITPVQTNRTPTENPNPDDEDMESYYARRTVETTPKRQPFLPPGGLH